MHCKHCLGPVGASVDADLTVQPFDAAALPTPCIAVCCLCGFAMLYDSDGWHLLTPQQMVVLATHPHAREAMRHARYLHDAQSVYRAVGPFTMN